MKKEFRCCFAGHSDINISTEKEKVKEIAEKLIAQYCVKEFWVGNYGNFDFCCAKAIMELKEIYPDIKIFVVIPYLTKRITELKEEYYKKFDEIITANISLSTPKRLFILKTNEYIVNNSKFMICYVNRSWGGAVQTFEYAKRRKLEIFNIAECTSRRDERK